LARHYQRLGHEVVCVARHREGWSGDGMFLEWDGKNPGPWTLALEGAERVINLAGRSVNCRYDERNKRSIIESRVDSTRAIGAAIAACKVPPKLWLNSSTATLYRHAMDKPQDEWLGEPGEGFSVEVARAWEEAFFAAKVPGATRKVALRTGMVLANEDGTVFDVLRHLTRRGLGGTMGKGDQRVSWIHIEDFLSAVDFISADPLLDGVFNLTAPEFPTNRELMRGFREQQGVPCGIPAAKWMLELGGPAASAGGRLPLALAAADRRARRSRGTAGLGRFLLPTGAPLGRGAGVDAGEESRGGFPLVCSPGPSRQGRRRGGGLPWCGSSDPGAGGGFQFRLPDAVSGGSSP
jgi:uncharacterized protein (TIGR01777 family)